MSNMPRFRSVFSERCKTIVNMVRNENNHDTLTPTSSNKINKEVSIDNTITQLYARPYSMTTSLFDTFCDTQTTLNSYHFQDLPYFINKLNEDCNTDSELCAKRLSTPTLELNNLFCHEKMPSIAEDEPVSQCDLSNGYSLAVNNNTFSTSGTPSPIAQIIPLDFDSDDSVRDKNYIPSSSSEDSDDGFPIRNPIIKSMPTNITKASTSATTVTPRQALQPANAINTHLAKKRRKTLDYCELNCQELQNIPNKRRITIDTILSSEKENSQVVSNKKRKIYKTSLAQRMTELKQLKIKKYSVKPGCTEKCFKKCSMFISEEQRTNINKGFWSLTWEQRRVCLRQLMSIAIPKRLSSKQLRKPRRCFTLKTDNGNTHEVCKVFFLTTLGFNKNNDKILRLNSDVDNRGKHQKTPAYDRQILTQHVESFYPYEPHYRREHAPLRRYLSSEINIRHMHKDFCEKYPDSVVSYELYRKHLRSMNISFTKLGNEDCEICESYILHSKQTSHDAKAQLQSDCSTCVQYIQHHERYIKARQVYSSHKTLPQNANQIFYSADLEKVIMLPRMETFKSVIFCQRLIAFNQTFAPVGKININNKPITIIWHDAIAGRKQDDIMSAFYAFLIRNRDVRNVNIWLDNCSAQNKNWLLFSLLIHMVNSNLISTSNITLYYFEPGHTFMSADQVHHQVELAMKNKKKLYDFQDFLECILTINKGIVEVNSLSPQHFINIPNFISDRRIQKSTPRAYLKNMVTVNFRRDNYDLFYKNNFDDDYTVLRFMNDRYLKNPNILQITFRSTPKGIDPLRKSNIIDKLSPLIPSHKLLFWTNLPITGENAEPTVSDLSRNSI